LPERLTMPEKLKLTSLSSPAAKSTLCESCSDCIVTQI